MENSSCELTNHALPPEMETLQVNPEAILLHVDQIQANGFTLIEKALPLSLIEAMRVQFDPLIEEHRRACTTNRGSNRYQMYLPFEPPFSSPLLIEHPVVLAVLRRVLGERFLLNYFASDTPFPGSDYQAIHSDGEPLFPGTQVSLPCYAVVLNIALVDVTEENGPMEIWAGGTHSLTAQVNVEKAAQKMASQRLTMKAGDILLRDPRAWHRGTPNHGARSRPNIALLYARSWYRFGLDLPTIRRSQFDSLSESAQSMLRYATLLDG